jgi:hypothetical protein
MDFDPFLGHAANFQYHRKRYPVYSIPAPQSIFTDPCGAAQTTTTRERLGDDGCAHRCDPDGSLHHLPYRIPYRSYC